MEFIQFHPTGMVWPPALKASRDRGRARRRRLLRNKEGRRFMFDDIPDNYKNQTADNEEEGWRYTQRRQERPPASELLTRPRGPLHVREVRPGAAPARGVFLDISWIKERLPNARRAYPQELPSMYHQFKELAGLDITTTTDGDRADPHYIMGGVKVDADTQMSNVRACSRQGSARRESNAQPPGRQLAFRPSRLRHAPASTPRSTRRRTARARRTPRRSTK